MIIQQVDSLGRIVVDGVGYVMKGTDEAPIHISYTNDRKKITFHVITGALKRPNQDDWINQIIPCCVYYTQKNRKLFAIAETLKAKEKIAFKGCLYKFNSVAKTGEVFINKRVIVEWLMPERCIETSDIKGNVRSVFPVDSDEYMF